MGIFFPIDLLLLQAQQPSLSFDPKLGLEFLLVAGVTVVANYVTLKTGQAEQNRLLVALHKRFDELEASQHKQEVETARLDERQKYLYAEMQALKQTQRLWPKPEEQ